MFYGTGALMPKQRVQHLSSAHLSVEYGVKLCRGKCTARQWWCWEMQCKCNSKCIHSNTVWESGRSHQKVILNSQRANVIGILLHYIQLVCIIQKASRDIFPVFIYNPFSPSDLSFFQGFRTKCRGIRATVCQCDFRWGGWSDGVEKL